jgi:hypothetical protein
MNLRFRVFMLTLATTLGLSAYAASPQQGGGEGQDQSAQAGSTEAATSQTDRLAAAPPSLLGPEALSPGRASPDPTFFSPSLQIFERASTNLPVPSLQRLDTSSPIASSRRFGTEDTIVVGLTGEGVGRHSRTIAEYFGNVSVFNESSNLDSTAHQVGLTWIYQGPRWSWRADERADLLPQTAFGYGGFGMLGNQVLNLGGELGANLPDLSSSFNPQQTIFTSYGNRVSDVTAMSAEYVVNPRSVVVLSAWYGLITFLKKGNIDSTQKMATISYNHSLTARDYVGVSYGFGQFQFQPIGDSFNVQFVEIGYGHRVLGKISLSAGGGPEVLEFHNPFFGNSPSLTWIADGSVQWRSTRNRFALTAVRSTSNGGGVLAGSIVERVILNWNHQLSRKWEGSIGSGYARNISLPQTFFFFSTTPEKSIDSVYGTARLRRNLGHLMDMFLQYQVWDQTSRNGVTTGRGYLNHTVELGFAWHRRPILIE